ncbi:DUF349 domain-containing protein [Arthrobacter terrae]
MTDSQQSDDMARIHPVDETDHTVMEVPAVETPAVETPAAEVPAVETPAAEVPALETPVAETPAAEVPAPTAAQRRIPSPAAFAARPRPAAPLPRAEGAAAAPSPAGTSLTGTSLATAAKWGRAEEDGHVYVLIDGEEQPVGQFPGASTDEALSYFARKFDDVAAAITLLEQRVEAKAPSADMHKTVGHLREQLAERNAVGDIRGAEQRLDSLDLSIKALEVAERAVHQAARAVELKSREAIVVEAEEISGQDPDSIQWKTSSSRMNELFELWKTAQKNGMRLGRNTEEALWKRFRAARTDFDRHRRAYFSALDSNNSAAKSVKENIIAEAEALSSSTDWGYAAGEYRRLMDQWKAAPRASRKDDDALWARFRGAQDKFFAARQSVNEELDQEFSANLVVKEALIAEAKLLLPIQSLAAAKKSLQSIRDRWEAAGKVPRADMQRVEAGLRVVEDAVRKAEEDNWRRTDPEAKARTSSALSQLEATIAALRDDLAAAEATGDQRKLTKAQEALAARELWLEQIQKAAEDFD